MDAKSEIELKQLKNEKKNILILVVAAVGYLLFFLLTGKGIPCVFRAVTGLLCPGCGMTRAIGALVRGDWRLALEYNQLCLSVLPLCALYLVFRCARRFYNGYEGFRIWEYFFLTGMLFITIGYGVLRNIS